MYHNVETPTGRVQTCVQTGVPLPIPELPAAWLEAPAWLLAPVAGEIGDPWAAALPAGAYVGVAWQGLLRRLVAGERVARRAPTASAILARADLVGVSHRDVAPDTPLEALTALLKPGARLVVTRGQEGGLVVTVGASGPEAIRPLRRPARGPGRSIRPVPGTRSWRHSMSIVAEPSLVGEDRIPIRAGLRVAAAAGALVVEGAGLCRGTRPPGGSGPAGRGPGRGDGARHAGSGRRGGRSARLTGDSGPVMRRGRRPRSTRTGAAGSSGSPTARDRVRGRPPRRRAPRRLGRAGRPRAPSRWRPDGDPNRRRPLGDDPDLEHVVATAEARQGHALPIDGQPRAFGRQRAGGTRPGRDEERVAIGLGRGEHVGPGCLARVGQDRKRDGPWSGQLRSRRGQDRAGHSGSAAAGSADLRVCDPALLGRGTRARGAGRGTGCRSAGPRRCRRAGRARCSRRPSTGRR